MYSSTFGTPTSSASSSSSASSNQATKLPRYPSSTSSPPSKSIVGSFKRSPILESILESSALMASFTAAPANSSIVMFQTVDLAIGRADIGNNQKQSPPPIPFATPNHLPILDSPSASRYHTLSYQACWIHNDISGVYPTANSAAQRPFRPIESYAV